MHPSPLSAIVWRGKAHVASKPISWLMASLVILLFPFSAVQAQLALKSGIGGWALGHSMVEGELRISPRTTVAARVGGIHGKKSTQIDLLDLNPPLLAGLFVKAGPKFGLGQAHLGKMKGFALQPQAVFSYWHDWDHRGWGGFGWRWEMGVGALCQASYRWQPWEHVLIEPQFSVGWMTTFDKIDALNDTPPFEKYDGTWFRIDSDEVESGRHTHLPLVSDLSISAGLLIGFEL